MGARNLDDCVSDLPLSSRDFFLGVKTPCGKCVVDPYADLHQVRAYRYPLTGRACPPDFMWPVDELCEHRAHARHGPDVVPQRRRKGLSRSSTAANRRKTMIAYLFIYSGCMTRLRLLQL